MPFYNYYLSHKRHGRLQSSSGYVTRYTSSSAAPNNDSRPHHAENFEEMAMTSAPLDFSTTYVYSPLQGRRYIRLLECTTDTNTLGPRYSLVQYELPTETTLTHFEAISYTWGDPERVSALHFHDEPGMIGLTANLTEALPYLIAQSHTKRLWIDQLCINQSDNAEKAVQIGLMSEIYAKAPRVIVWLGGADEHAQICRQWLHAIEEVIPTLEIADRITHGTDSYDPNIRNLFLRNTFVDPATDPMFATAIRAFWQRPYFRRVWICQEFILATEILCLAGDLSFTFQDLVDFTTIPVTNLDGNEVSVSFRILVSTKLHPYTDPAPLRFLRLMVAMSSEFESREIVDQLFGCLGMMDGLNFIPDYELSVKQNFTRFAATLASEYGSLDFLSLWAWNIDPLVTNTPEILMGFPSWVPSWSATPLFTPCRLATGGLKQNRYEIFWDAAAGRKHVHDQVEDAVTTERPHVRGKIIDRIDVVSSIRFNKYLADIDDAYIDSLVNQIKIDMPNLSHWTQVDLVRFFSTVTANGGVPDRSAEDLLSTSQEGKNSVRNTSGWREGLGIALAMGRGRRFVRTEKGRLGLAPAVGSQARSGQKNGSAIVVLHGCTVPVVLENVDETAGDWKLLGDCYIEDVMRGQAVDWDEECTETFVLV
jgi:hypothetical protein